MPEPTPHPARRGPSPARLLAPPSTRFFAPLLAGLAVAACGGGGGGGAPPSATPPDPPSASYLVSYMYDWYYWADRLPPAPAPDTWPDAHAALAALKVAEDRYSYIEPAATYDAFFDEGRSLGFGITYQLEADALALRLVQPLSPAHAAGLRRGDRIVAIDGRAVADILAEDALADAFGLTEVGAALEFDVRSGDAQRQVRVARDWYDVSYVIAPGVHVAGDRRVGYINFYSFGRLGLAPWQAALDRLLAEGAQDLVVDLRENGGGLVATAAQVGSALGADDLAGRTMGQLEFNRAHTDADRTFRFSSDPRAGRFDRIVWLTGARTCSASEILIAGLDPWRAATRIGSATCGKPVGFTPPSHEGWIYAIVSFSMRNALGEGDYYDGLAPDCTVPDPVVGEFGDPGEPLLAAALSWLADGQCPAAVAGKTLSSPPRPDDSLRGLSTLTGLR